MNPIAYCAIASCTDKDWFVMGVVILALLALGFIAVVIDFLLTKFGKDRDMK